MPRSILWGRGEDSRKRGAIPRWVQILACAWNVTLWEMTGAGVEGYLHRTGSQEALPAPGFSEFLEIVPSTVSGLN